MRWTKKREPMQKREPSFFALSVFGRLLDTLFSINQKSRPKRQQVLHTGIINGTKP
jgi:hypothetical protein